MKSFAGVIMSCIYAVIIATPGVAQTPSNNTVTVAPSISDISVDPGSKGSGRFTVANQGLKSFSLELSVAPYSIINEQYDASFEPLPGRVPVTEWINLSEIPSSSLSPGKYDDVMFDITVPQSTKPGGYSAVIFVETAGEDNLSESVKIRNRVAHILYITVNGPVQRDIRIDGPNISLVTFSGDKIGYTMVNEGGSNETAQVRTTVSDIFGRDILENTISRYVLPGTKRSLTLEWQPAEIFGIYKVTASMSGTKDTANTRWVVVLSPLFLTITSIMIIVLLWRFRMRTRTMRKRINIHEN